MPIVYERDFFGTSKYILFKNEVTIPSSRSSSSSKNRGEIKKVKGQVHEGNSYINFLRNIVYRAYEKLRVRDKSWVKIRIGLKVKGEVGVSFNLRRTNFKGLKNFEGKKFFKG